MTYFVLYCNNAKFERIESSGIPFVLVARKGVFRIGKNFRMNNTFSGNPIGRNKKCVIFVDNSMKV